MLVHPFAQELVSRTQVDHAVRHSAELDPRKPLLEARWRLRPREGHRFVPERFALHLRSVFSRALAAIFATELAVEEQKETGEKKSGGSQTAMSAYRGKLFSHISKKKVNPRSKIAGIVVVRFKVGPEGELISREVATSSGSKLLDDAAVQSIERAAPFPKMPDDAEKKEPMVVSVPFKFSVR